MYILFVYIIYALNSIRKPVLTPHEDFYEWLHVKLSDVRKTVILMNLSEPQTC